jgi:hypothetical protein
MKNLFLTTIILMIFSSLNAQEDAGKRQSNQFSGLMDYLTPPGYNYLYKAPGFNNSTDGSIFLGDWERANVLFKNGKAIASLKMRYNVYENQMLYRHDDTTYVIGTPDSIAEIKFPNKKFVYKNLVHEDKSEKTFLEVLYASKITLYNAYRIEVVPANYNQALDVGSKNDLFKIKEQLYFLVDTKFVVLKKMSKLLDLLGDKKKEVSDYVDKEHLSIKNKEDIVKVLSYYQQLTTRK